MAYSWAQLAFVEKWRLHGVRGQVIGMHRPADRTFFDLRLRPSEGLFSATGPVQDLHLVDAGDIIREKRIGLLEKALVVIRVAGTISEAPGGLQAADRPRRLLEAGSTVTGSIMSAEEDIVLLDVGFPVVVQLPEPLPKADPGLRLHLTLTDAPKGFLVV